MSNQATDPRIAKKEMIVTRNKSAQQKHQLRDKDRSMAKVTQLLKSHKTYKNLKKKPKTPEKRSPSDRNTVTNNKRKGDTSKEYYPNKLRRKFEEKRIFLRPKYESHTVVKLNKRKLGTPQRGTTLEEMQSQSQSEDDWLSIYDNKSDLFADLSMEEMVRIVEETESLDDEDLMEILTCPSPVWWEDPPDKGYIEEAIFTRKPEIMQNTPRIKKSRKEKPKNIPKKENKKAKKSEEPATTDFINIVKTDDRFLKKRSKLENVLGNIIKNKVNSETKNNTDNKSKDDTTKESNVTEVSNERKEKRNSESTESFPDLCSNNEEMLRDLENMDIPVEVSCNKLVEETNLEDKELFGKEIKRELDTESIKQNESPASNVPLNLPRLTKRPKLESQESPSVKSLSDETELSSLSGQENIDTISDTNIKFIIDDDVDILNDNKDSLNQTKKEIDSDVKSKANEDVLKALHDKKEYITVYKIVSCDTQEKCDVNKFKNIPEYSSYVENLMKQESGSDDSKCNGQLNSFFKKCKFVNRKKKKEIDAKATDSEESFCDKCEPQKCITVAQDENVKYCLNCSSIFDTDDCSYCLKSKNGDKDEIENKAILIG